MSRRGERRVNTYFGWEKSRCSLTCRSVATSPPLEQRGAHTTSTIIFICSLVWGDDHRLFLSLLSLSLSLTRKARISTIHTLCACPAECLNSHLDGSVRIRLPGGLTPCFFLDVRSCHVGTRRRESVLPFLVGKYQRWQAAEETHTKTHFAEREKGRGGREVSVQTRKRSRTLGLLLYSGFATQTSPTPLHVCGVAPVSCCVLRSEKTRVSRPSPAG